MTSTTTRYLLADAPRQADERFAALAACFDRNTFETLTSIGIASGWRCWEVGAGGASVPTWLAGRVGATGTVVATDIDITHLSPAPPGVDVREHDIATDHSPGAAFDLVHARLLLTHVPERRRALQAMAGALSPGGWLVIEDFDVAMGPAACLDPQSADERRANKIRAAFVTLLAERGVDLTFGRDLPRQLRSLGLVDVRAEAHFPISDPATRTLERANARQVADALVAGGHATSAEIDDHLAALDHLDIATPPLVTVRARRPERDERKSRVEAIDDTMATSSGVVTVRPEAGTLERDRSTSSSASPSARPEHGRSRCSSSSSRRVPARRAFPPAPRNGHLRARWSRRGRVGSEPRAPHSADRRFRAHPCRRDPRPTQSQHHRTGLSDRGTDRPERTRTDRADRRDPRSRVGWCSPRGDAEAVNTSSTSSTRRARVAGCARERALSDEPGCQTPRDPISCARDVAIARWAGSRSLCIQYGFPDAASGGTR